MFLQSAKLYRELSKQSWDEQNFEEYEMLVQSAADIENFFAQRKHEFRMEEEVTSETPTGDSIFEEETETDLLTMEFHDIAKLLLHEPVEVGGEEQEVVEEAIRYLENAWQNRFVSDEERPFAESVNNLRESVIDNSYSADNPSKYKHLSNLRIRALIELLKIVPYSSHAGSGSSPPAKMFEIVLRCVLRSHSSGIAKDSHPSSEFPFSLDNVVIGNHNRPVQTIVEKSLDDPASFFNPLIIYGSTGLGKTTLLKSIATMYSKRGFSVFYCSSSQFIDDFAAAKGGIGELLMHVYKEVDVLLFDDLQPLSKKKKTQKRFSDILEYLIEHGRRVIVTSECLPVHMKLEEYLIKQLDTGVPISVEAPDVETKVNLLKSMTANTSHSFSEDVLRKIAERVESNIRDLEGAVKFVSVQMELEEDSDVNSALEKWEHQRKGEIKQRKQEATPEVLLSMPVPG